MSIHVAATWSHKAAFHEQTNLPKNEEFPYLHDKCYGFAQNQIVNGDDRNEMVSNMEEYDEVADTFF
jgi:hypothetical protein